MSTVSNVSARDDSQREESAIAIVGMALTVPGAENISQFWQNLRGGVESIRRLNHDTLLENGERPEALVNPNYVPAAAVLDGYADFDPEFFGFTPKEAAILDPQHRKFLEVSWEALENAGHPPKGFVGDIGVFGGCGMGSYLYFNICSNPGLVEDVGMFLLRHTGNDKDFLTTRVSHVFDLTGASVNVQTACSTSLVAVHYAREALLRGECDMALAGGSTIELPQGRGYLYKENEILSPDGHCHAFDHRAKGTVFGSGAGVVVLRRLKDALADGDHIHAVIRGTAVNNDGAAKASYLAPSVDGQVIAVTRALEEAGVAADTIDYVECHGTGTYLGDPIEIAALTEAFRATTDETGFCRVGSVKSNIGHLDTAAGVASLIKTTLALTHKEIPPTLGFEAPNPAIDFEHSPFKVADRLVPWTSHKGPRRAGVTALGVGGTNAHIVLEEAPERAPSQEPDWPFQLLTLSARGTPALDANAAKLATWLRAHPDADLADVAWTLKQGRAGLPKRRVLVAETPQEAAALLEAGNPRRVFAHDDLGPDADIAFLFPGGGAQYPNMGRDLYETEPVFAEWMDRGLDHLVSKLDYDPRALWLPEPGQEAAAAAALMTPSAQLPLIMIVEYALAQLWLSWGVKPAVLIGHSMGENTAAALAGVIAFEDCIDLVLLRGQLFDTVPPGGMLSVPMPEADLRLLVGDGLDIASVNAPALCAVSGPKAKLEALKADLARREIEAQMVPIDIAAHSRMLDPILDAFRAFLTGLTLHAPTMPVLSNRTGLPLTAAQATDPDYWVSQLRNTVLFGACIAHAAEKPDRIYLEVGPGKALATLAHMNAKVKPAQVINSLRHPDDEIADDAHFLGVIGRLWACGYEADWDQIWGEAKRNRVQLPTYAFQRSRYFIEPGAGAADSSAQALTRIEDMSGWGYVPGWQKRYAETDSAVLADPSKGGAERWLVFLDELGLGAQVAARLAAAGHQVTRVSPGDSFARLADDHYILPTEQGRAPVDALVAALAEADRLPSRVAHFWLVTEGEHFRPGSSFFYRNVEHGFYSLMTLGQALAEADRLDGVQVTVFTNGAAQVADEALPYPEKALISGPIGVIPREVPGTTWASVDLDLPVAARKRWRRSAPDVATERAVTAALEELLAPPRGYRAALRDGNRFEQSVHPAPLPETGASFAEGGVWLITGGLGGIGQTLARDLVEQGAKVVLVGRTVLPPREDWARLLHQTWPGDPVVQAIRALQSLEAGGGAIRYHAGDVTDIARLRDIAEATRAEFGPVTGVIHAAGVIDDAPFLTKESFATEAVFAPKINGLRAIDEVFPDGALDTLVLFASTSTATTPAGQIDYVAANAYLNAYAQSRAGGRTRVVAVNWGVWADTGMAATAMAEARGDAACEPQVVDQPLLEQGRFDAEGRRLLTATHTGETWVYDEHRTKAGERLLPGTGYVELVAEAMQAHHVEMPYEIRDLTFLRPLGLGAAERKAVSLRLTAESGGVSVEARSGVRLGEREGTVLHAEAEVIAREWDAPRLDLDQLTARCRDARLPDGVPLRGPQEANLAFGPRWRVLDAMRFGAGEGVAELTLPEAYRDDLDAGFVLHPGLLDQATGWAMELIPGYTATRLWVPLAYRSIKVFAPLPAAITSWVRLAGGSGEAGFARFDITLADREGRVLVEIEGFEMKRLETQAGFVAAPITEPEVEFAESGAQPQLSPNEARLHHNISQGIRAEEGVQALKRALAMGRAQVYVSSLDLAGLIDQAGEVDEVQVPLPAFAHAERDDYAAPETATQKELAAIWENLLGISPVGIRDDFFDLGGHSLLAVRLFGQIKRAFAVQFPISVLFEAPTIEKIAALIDEKIGPRDAPEAVGELPEAQDKPLHLVTLHGGAAASSKRPFFLVAGMFGNVLNLRHLALLIGRDRAVYGLQARGLLDEEEPHRSFEAAAADYLAELRAVQPQGPYLLGGFSGGGLIAYEMAQQLRAAGEEVAVLALLDTPLPVRPGLTRRDKAAIKLQELRRKGLSYLWEWGRNRLAWELGKRGFGPGGAQADESASFHNTKIEAAFREASAVYHLQRWDGPLTLFRPPLDLYWKVSEGNWVSRAREYVYADNQWTGFAPRTEVIEVPGDHDSMVLMPNVSVLAKRLKAVIDDAERARPVARDESAALHARTAAE